MIKTVLISLAAGGFITSAFEYFLKYNLIDLLKDKIVALFKGAKSEAISIEAKVVKKL